LNLQKIAHFWIGNCLVLLMNPWASFQKIMVKTQKALDIPTALCYSHNA